MKRKELIMELKMQFNTLRKHLFTYKIIAKEIINAIIQEKETPTDLSNNRWMSETYKGNKYINKINYLYYIKDCKHYNIFNSYNQKLFEEFLFFLNKQSARCKYARNNKDKIEISNSFVKFLTKKKQNGLEWHHVNDGAGHIERVYFINREDIKILLTDNIFKNEKNCLLGKIKKILIKIDKYI